MPTLMQFAHVVMSLATSCGILNVNLQRRSVVLAADGSFFLYWYFGSIALFNYWWKRLRC